MKCIKESKSSLFSRSHSAVSLRTNLFFLKKKKKNHTPLGVFISDPHVSGELFFPPLQLADLLFLPL